METVLGGGGGLIVAVGSGVCMCMCGCGCVDMAVYALCVWHVARLFGVSVSMQGHVLDGLCVLCACHVYVHVHEHEEEER